jgi:nicotinate-nucleotide--dimethylbenzimidazole phosphoribosyltransferase
VLVFAADHGVAAEGVSLYPQDVTAQMVANFTSGGAAINVLARHSGFDVRVVDAGVNADVDAADDMVEQLSVRRGSGNIAHTPALSAEECEQAITNGQELAGRVVAQGYELVALGDMGIANTTVAAAVLAGLGMPVQDVVDRGTGIDDSALQKKRKVVQAALARHGASRDPREVVASLGGPDFATMMGFILALRGTGIACVLDGFPVSASAYLAFSEDPGVRSFLFAGHRSKVRGHGPVLSALGLEPIVDFGMRLGEGTGAVLGGTILELAAALAGEMATFSSAGVSESTTDEQDY